MKTLNFRNDILPLKDKLFRLALRLVPDVAEAEDLVQDTLIKVWNKREEWANISSAEAYCLTTCRNLALDRIEKRKIRQTEKLQEDLHTPAGMQPSTPEDEISRQEQGEILQQLLNNLPEIQRSILVLRDIEGQSYKEIAGILSLSEEQVKVYLYRARQKVKQMYTKIDAYGL